MEPEHICGARVRYGRVTGGPSRPLLDEAGPQGQSRLTADRHSARLDIADVGRFRIEEGALITVDPAPGSSQRALDCYLYGTVAGLLLGQRGEFALHASTAAIGSGGVAITGLSGAGKSTTVLTLRRWGHRLVTDDVSPMHLPDADPSPADTGTRPVVTPFGRPIHVWPATAAAVGVDTADGQPILPGSQKLTLPGPLGEPVPLLALAELCCSPDVAGVTGRQLVGVDALDALLRNVYRPLLVHRLWPQELFAWATAMYRRLPTWQLTRNPQQWSADAVAEHSLRLAAPPVRPRNRPDRGVTVGAAGR